MLEEAALNGAALAYLGDAVLELMTREYLLSSGKTNVGELNAMALKFVKATAQSDAAANILPLLSEEEIDIYKRGRNTHGLAIPKSASAGQYRRATGLEALFAHLYINGQTSRMKELFRIGFIENSVSPDDCSKADCEKES